MIPPVESIPLPLHALLTDIIEPIVVRNPCEKCVSRDKQHLCFDAVHQLGYECDKYQLLLKNHDIDDLVKRIESLEKYIAVLELQRKVPRDVATEITKYY